MIGSSKLHDVIKIGTVNLLASSFIIPRILPVYSMSMCRIWGITILKSLP